MKDLRFLVERMFLTSFGRRIDTKLVESSDLKRSGFVIAQLDGDVDFSKERRQDVRVTDDLSGVVVEFLEVRQGFEDLSASCDPRFPWNRFVGF